MTTSTSAQGGGPTVVVGVDGSPSSLAAVRWAHHQAHLLGARLVAVSCWEYPEFYGWAPSPGFDFEANALSGLDAALTEALGADAGAVERRVVEGHPAPALIAVAQDADLLVVGSRGHGGFAGLVLGSVSEQVVGRAHCPVVVVTARSERPAA